MKKYIKKYNWISWPDQDEFLEGPNRDKSYYQYICDVFESEYNWVRFNNFNYWFTEKDDPSITKVCDRIKYYSIFNDCCPRIRAWKSAVTNIRNFNHNALSGKKYPTDFNLRHYSVRSYAHLIKKLKKDRAGIRRGEQNRHYENLVKKINNLHIPIEKLWYDDGGKLNDTENFNWKQYYLE